MSTNAATDIAVREYRDDDEVEVLALLEAALGAGPTGGRSAEFFRWKHLENPFGRSLMLVAEAEGRVVGLRAFMRWRFTAFGRDVRAVRAVDTATHPDFQGRGIFSRLTLEALDLLRAETHLVFNTPNEKSLPGYLKMGWRTVGTVPIRIGVRHPIRFARAVRTFQNPAEEGGILADRGLPAAAVLATLADADKRVPGERIATVADQHFLEWRYGRAPFLGYRAIARGDGIALFRVRHRGASVEATVADVRVRDGDVGTARRLLGAVGRVSGADHVACAFPAATAQDRAARRRAYLRAPRGMTLVVNPLRDDLWFDPTDLASWGLVLGDLEVF